MPNKLFWHHGLASSWAYPKDTDNRTCYRIQKTSAGYYAKHYDEEGTPTILGLHSSDLEMAKRDCESHLAEQENLAMPDNDKDKLDPSQQDQEETESNYVEEGDDDQYADEGDDDLYDETEDENDAIPEGESSPSVR